jgi:hypothetical protein
MRFLAIDSFKWMAEGKGAASLYLDEVKGSVAAQGN